MITWSLQCTTGRSLTTTERRLGCLTERERFNGPALPPALYQRCSPRMQWPVSQFNEADVGDNHVCQRGDGLGQSSA